MKAHEQHGWIPLIVLGGLLEALAIWTAPRMAVDDRFIPFLSGYLAMVGIYLVAVYFVCQRVNAPKRTAHFILVVAVFLRLPFLFAPPELSDDIYRYVWDGRVQRAGINPYRYAPQAPELQHLRDPLYQGINNKDISTIYPPLMQIVFASVTAISESLLWMKGVLVLIDLVVIGLLIGLLEMVGMNTSRAVIYAWSPLVIIEVAGNGHNDVLALAFLLAAHGALFLKKDIWSVVLLCFSGLAKLMGFILAPLFVRSVRARAWLALPLTILIVSIPYIDVGSEAFQGLYAYGTRWRANDSLFALIYQATGSLDLSKGIVAGLLGGLMGYLILRDVPPLRGCYLAIGAILLFTTTLHPWYLMWIVPYLCFHTNAAWLLLTGTIVLSYHAPFLTPPGEAWVQHSIYKLLEYGPFFALLVVLACSPHRRFLGNNASKIE